MNIVISSGKGGTGKTLVATNLAYILAQEGRKVSYLDCDVEEPNGHLFLKTNQSRQEDVLVSVPFSVDEEKCINCGKCQEACQYNAIAVLKDKVLFFSNLCHTCGACEIACPQGAIIKKDKKIGTLVHARAEQSIELHYGLLETAEGAMTTRLIEQVKKNKKEDAINIFDSPPGTACPAVVSLKDADLAVLVTDPTPFGIHDLKLAVDMSRKIGKEPVVLINRATLPSEELRDYCSKDKLEIVGEIPDDIEIARTYSSGGLIAEETPKYKELFFDLALRLEEYAGKVRKVRKTPQVQEELTVKTQELERVSSGSVARKREIVIISGKGGTGKTSVAGCFAALSRKCVFADCDVDAPDLHLLLKPKIKQTGFFSGGLEFKIDQKRCTRCGKCFAVCRFESIKKQEGAYRIDPVSCEGCGVCKLVCEEGAVKVKDAVNGKWFVSDTRFGPFAHAQLGVAQENTGKLVTLVRNKASEAASGEGFENIIIDGSPGVGCPVIASLVGAFYAVVVTEPTVSGVHDMKRILELTKHFSIRTGIIVNKYDLNLEKTDKIKEVIAARSIDLLGVIPYDKAITEAQIEGISLVEYKQSPASLKIKEIWQRLTEEVL